MTWWCDKNQKHQHYSIDKGGKLMIQKYQILSFYFLHLDWEKLYLIWSCFYCWICWFIIVKLRFKSRDLDSSSQVQGSPCGQELAKLGPQTHTVLVMWAQGQLGTAWPIRSLALLSLTNERPAEAGSCGQHMPDPSQQSSSSSGQRAVSLGLICPHWPQVTSC